MRYFYAAATFSLALAMAPAANAQNAPGSSPAGMSGPNIQPRAPEPDIAPPALPGAGETPGIATAPKLAKTFTGDPTTALFDAINKDDYSAAQDALSRGADLNAQNGLGETPLDLAIELNHNNITFMILSARNEDGDNAGASETVTATPGAAPALHHHRMHVTPANVQSPMAAAKPARSPSSPGAPDVRAGYLGFEQN
jgi:hypothetical protein